MDIKNFPRIRPMEIDSAKDILKSVLVSFNCQMCLLSSVLNLFLGLVKEALWFVNLVLSVTETIVNLNF